MNLKIINNYRLSGRYIIAEINKKATILTASISMVEVEKEVS
jgi:hypothetical protein